MAIDFRQALNTISDVVQNRPAPLREFDQIYMKVGDMVIQAEFIARQFRDQSMVFIGDGDAISLSMMHLSQKGVLKHSPKEIHVLDFDERIVNSINEFAYKNNLSEKIRATLYNVADPLPENMRRRFGGFYTNPPWGASNDGVSVTSFLARGIEATLAGGLAALVIADGTELKWAGAVLLQAQRKLLANGFAVTEMLPGLHEYHLDDTPDLTSCCILARNVDPGQLKSENDHLDSKALENFYGRNNPLRVRFVRDLARLNRDRAADGSYELEPFEAQP